MTKLTATLLDYQGKQRLTTSHLDLAHELERLQAEEHYRTTCLQAHAELLSDPMSTSKMLIGGAKSWKMKKTEFNVDAWNQFTSTYYAELEAAYDAGQYVENLPATFTRMLWAIVNGSYSKDSEAFRKTCKVLKIKHTYKAIDNYLRGN